MFSLSFICRGFRPLQSFHELCNSLRLAPIASFLHLHLLPTHSSSSTSIFLICSICFSLTLPPQPLSLIFFFHHSISSFHHSISSFHHSIFSPHHFHSTSFDPNDPNKQLIYAVALATAIIGLIALNKLVVVVGVGAIVVVVIIAIIVVVVVFAIVAFIVVVVIAAIIVVVFFAIVVVVIVTFTVVTTFYLLLLLFSIFTLTR